MGDASLWVAMVTAVTAIAASWVTSRGNAQAARVQARAAAEAQHAAIRRDTMRTAHLAFIDQINHMGALYRRTPKLLEIDAPSDRSAALERHLDELRAAYGEFHRQLNVVMLDGGCSALAAANAVHNASTHVYKTLLNIAAGTQEPDDFAPAVRAYWNVATAFLHAARLGGEER
ncbi:hypothetical protein [Streptomyces griseosporeus]|uniref:hypothetical protein n=1 Tax=Streptomyces griseosporeus TaxID=1910 RepID=UPI0037AB32E5